MRVTVVLAGLNGDRPVPQQVPCLARDDPQLRQIGIGEGL
jgi:hypothetical protein